MKLNNYRNLISVGIGFAILSFALPSCSLFGGDSTTGENEEAPEVHRVFIDSIHPDDTVYICTGSGSKRFHASDSCTGLNGCRKEVRGLTRREAEKKKRTHCQICISDEQVE